MSEETMAFVLCIGVAFCLGWVVAGIRRPLTGALAEVVREDRLVVGTNGASLGRCGDRYVVTGTASPTFFDDPAAAVAAFLTEERA